MSMSWDESGKFDEVWAQVGNGERRRLGTTLVKPDNEWLTDRGADLAKVNKVEWSSILDCWVVKLNT